MSAIKRQYEDAVERGEVPETADTVREKLPETFEMPSGNDSIINPTTSY